MAQDLEMYGVNYFEIKVTDTLQRCPNHLRRMSRTDLSNIVSNCLFSAVCAMYLMEDYRFLLDRRVLWSSFMTDFAWRKLPFFF